MISLLRSSKLKYIIESVKKRKRLIKPYTSFTEIVVHINNIQSYQLTYVNDTMKIY